MFRLKPIPRRTRKPIARPVVRGLEAAFWIVFALAVGVGGESAVSGLGRIGGFLLPGMAAEAHPPPLSRDATLLLPGFARSMFAPEVLYPVAAHAFPKPVQPVPAKLIVRKRHAIAIVIDDLGDAEVTRRAIALPRAVSLSFLPFAPETPVLAREAERTGHEVLVHVPMQAENPRVDPGPMMLRTDFSAEENAGRLEWALSRVPGFAGINNHEGSRFTQDRTALAPVVQALNGRHVFFFDSRTTPASQVVPVSRAYGVPSAARDVFLDDTETAPAILAQFSRLEALARRDGVAIAIGHPHALTLAMIATWCAQDRDFQLVPVGTAIRLKTEHEMAVASTH
jgi:uncharacterized protein